jgi:hypothetical protein
MDDDANGLTEFDEDILTFDVQDAALERAVVVAGMGITTLGICTH